MSTRGEVAMVTFPFGSAYFACLSPKLPINGTNPTHVLCLSTTEHLPIKVSVSTQDTKEFLSLPGKLMEGKLW